MCLRAADVGRGRDDARPLRTRSGRAVPSPAPGGAGVATPRGAEVVIGDSPAMRRLRDLIRRIGQSDATAVLATGESGTGKGLVARALHAESARADRPFVSLTCSAIPEHLLESELFGHEPGAFTDARQAKPGLLEAAHGGTLFLDEIGDMTPMLQAKLLGVLEDRVLRRVGGLTEIPVDVRVISATHCCLEMLVEEGRFRPDLLYRLRVVPLHVPPLREHPSDIPALAEHFLRILGGNAGAVPRVTEEARVYLQAMRWPGNVRELRNALESAVVLTPGSELGVHAFTLHERPPGRATAFLPADGVDVDRLIDDLVREAMERTAHNQSAAARLLGMTRNQIRHRLQKLGLIPGPGRRRAGEPQGHIDDRGPREDGVLEPLTLPRKTQPAPRWAG
ncbi:MAG: sigma-54 interaction domain-containing protein [Planctomycetota bacterium]